MKDCVCRVVQKLQWNCGAICPNKRVCVQGSAKGTMELCSKVPNERLCVQCSAKVTIKLLCNSSK